MEIGENKTLNEIWKYVPETIKITQTDLKRVLAQIEEQQLD